MADLVRSQPTDLIPRLASWTELEAAWGCCCERNPDFERLWGRQPCLTQGVYGVGVVEALLPCPLHGSDHQGSFHVHISDDEKLGWYKCHKCQAHGRLYAPFPDWSTLPVIAGDRGHQGPGGWAGSGERDSEWDAVKGNRMRAHLHEEALAYTAGRLGSVEIAKHFLGEYGCLVALAGMHPSDWHAGIVRLQFPRWADADKRIGTGYAGRTLLPGKHQWRNSPHSSGVVHAGIGDADWLIVVEGAFDALAMHLLIALPHTQIPPALSAVQQRVPVPVAIQGVGVSRGDDPQVKGDVAASLCRREGQPPRSVLIAVDPDAKDKAAGIARVFAPHAAEVEIVSAEAVGGAKDWAELWTSKYASTWAPRAKIIPVPPRCPPIRVRFV